MKTEGGNTIKWYSCDECILHMSELTCGEGCEWLGEESGCVSSSILGVDITCEVLFKPLCDKFHEEHTSVSNLLVTDIPCFFNGESDSVKMLCVSMNSINGSDNCAVIKTNDVVVRGGKEGRYCDDASWVFGFDFSCVWKSDYGGERGWCGSVYYLVNNGMMSCWSSFLCMFCIFR
jgi:hypothetical protein